MAKTAPSMLYACPTCAAQPFVSCEENGKPVAYVHASRVEQAIAMAADGEGVLRPVTDRVIEATDLL